MKTIRINDTRYPTVENAVRAKLNEPNGDRDDDVNRYSCSIFFIFYPVFHKPEDKLHAKMNILWLI